MKHKYRSIFISDVHLGAKDVRNDCLLDFLNTVEAEYIYLVGDIVDFWKLKHNWHWPEINNAIVQRLLDKVKNGARVTYIPGNHDERLRDYIGSNLNDIVIREDAIHTTKDNKTLLLIHGDEFDSVVMTNKWLIHFGDWLYNRIVILNRHCNYVRRKLGFPYWSLSNFLKLRTKKALQYIESFENAVIREAQRRGVDGVVCGHIHHPAVKQTGGIIYANTGDWVENCTAIVEKKNGQLEMLRWTQVRELEKQPLPQVVSTASKAA
ncbi:MAG: UDP-2,3-diacylglucosamine diphosphatase [Gammaproteobacteria bacterium]|nr:UDP-2,3-diacylglucosamine diphosphatase [Gammaproteobacteria bacterium]